MLVPPWVCSLPVPLLLAWSGQSGLFVFMALPAFVLPVVVLSIAIGFLALTPAPPPESTVLLSIVVPVGAGLDWAKAGVAMPRASKEAATIFIRIGILPSNQWSMTREPLMMVIVPCQFPQVFP